MASSLTQTASSHSSWLLSEAKADIRQQGQGGVDAHVRAELFPTLKALVQARCPFANLPSSVCLCHDINALLRCVARRPANPLGVEFWTLYAILHRSLKL